MTSNQFILYGYIDVQYVAATGGGALSETGGSSTLYNHRYKKKIHSQADKLYSYVLQ